MNVGFQSFKQLPLLGKLLCVLLIALPQAMLFLHPNTLLPPSPNEIAFPMVLELVFIAALVIFRRRAGYQLPRVPLLVWISFALWLLASLMTLNTAVEPGQASHKYVQYLLHFLFTLGLFSFLAKEKQAVSTLYMTLLLSLYLMLGVFIILTAVMSQQPDFNWKGHLPGFSNVRHLDYLLAVMLSATVMLPYILKNECRGLSQAFFLATLFLLWLLLCWTGGRGSILSAFLATGLCLFVMRKHILTRKLVITFLAAMIAGALVSLFLPVPHHSYGLFRFSPEQLGGVNQYSSNRFSIWLESLELWLASPWFGIGAGQTLYVLARAASSQFVQPHNVVVQALLAWGVVGGLPFLAVLGGSLWSAFRHIEQRMTQNPSAIAGLAIMLTIAANAMIDGTLYHPMPTFLFLIGMGLALTPSLKKA